MGTLTDALERHEEFYSATQRRDSHGRWTTGGDATAGSEGQTSPKAWTGRSADPATREAPVARVRPRVGTLDRPLENPDIQKIVSWYTGDLGGGYSSRPALAEDPRAVRTSRIGDAYKGSSDHNSVQIDGIIEKDGQIVGSFKRTVGYFPNDGTLRVVHDELMISDPHQGQGLAGRFNSRAVEGYREAGVDRISVSTNEVGGYAWARQGFRALPGQRDDTIATLGTRVVQAVDEAHVSGRLSADQASEAKRRVRVLDAASRSGKDVQPYDVAHVGENEITWRDRVNGVEMTVWPGKIGLIGSNWQGEYLFDASDSLTASGARSETLDDVLHRRLERGVYGLSRAVRKRL